MQRTERVERPRFSSADVQQWHDTGFVIIEDFFFSGEIAPLLADFATLYAERGQGEGVGQVKNLKKAGEIGAFSASQFLNFDQMPYLASPAINLISMHPDLIRFARALLGEDQVHCYQSHTWAKYTGEADYDQMFHCDYRNHTLTVPADEASLRTVNFVIYLNDVTDDLGALHYLTRQDAGELLGADVLNPPDSMQPALKARERSAAGPAGALVAYGIDTLHRGTNLTRPDGKRFTMTVSYKAAGNEMIGFHVWQFAPDRPWHLIIEHASAEQLAVLGIPPPGDTFWTERTLHLTQARWPNWDMTAYFAANE